MVEWHWQNFGPDLPLLFKMHEIWSVDSQKIVKFVATRCQILRLNSISAGALPQTLLGSLQHSPDLLAGFKGPAFNLREGEERV